MKRQTLNVLPVLLIAVFVGASCATTAYSLKYEVVWDRSLIDGKYQLPRALIQTSDGGYALAGYGDVKRVRGGSKPGLVSEP